MGVSTCPRERLILADSVEKVGLPKRSNIDG